MCALNRADAERERERGVRALGEQDLALAWQYRCVTRMTRRETCGSKCKLFIVEHGQYRQGRAGANRYGMGKTQE